MKRVFLVGDSIRIGYDKYVKKALEGTCEVTFPSGNCQFAQYLLRYLHIWKDQCCTGEPDLVHWNAGLWDVLRILGDGCLTPPDAYGVFIEKICCRCERIFPQAKIIFATTTPGGEGRLTAEFERYNADIVRYNEIASEIVRRHGFGIDDLYTVVKNAPAECFSDETHLYTPMGTELTTNAVLRSVCGALEIPCPTFVYTEEL